MKNCIKLLFIVGLFIVPSLQTRAQNIKITARLDTNQILIGDQINLNLEITKPKNLDIKFPVLKDTIIKEIEVLGSNPPDTISTDSDNITLQKKYLITSFDSGLYVIPPLNFTYLNDTLIDTFPTNPVYLGVVTLEVDTASKKIFDIKKPYEAPWSFIEFLKLYWHYILIGIIATILLLLAYRIIKRLRKKEPIIKIIEKPVEPAHVIAYRELDALKSKKLWQQNKTKQYHSELTDIIRKYIENRFGITAMEQTTHEILDKYSRLELNKNNTIEYLKQMLILADFVKFAKANPLPDENDLSIKNAYKFVDETKKEATEEKTNANNNINNKETND